MTNRDDTRQFDPKHRIIGAIVVVATAVILVPLLLGQRDAPPDSSSLPSGAAAREGNKVAITQVTPPPALEPAKPASPPAAAPANPSASPASPATPASAKAPTGSVTTATKADPKHAVASSGWVVQVGTFANAANANRLEQKLRAGGQPVRAEQIKIDTGKAVRLRVGPFDDSVAALKAQERIQKDVGIKGVVLAYP
jgi:DedD protein